MYYNRNEAVEYAYKYALKRNPRFHDFSSLGGDCTNFISQCIFAGIKHMDYSKPNGWFYINLNNRSPSWTGVNEFYQFITTNKSNIIRASECNFDELELGDIVQLKQGNIYNHNLIVTKINYPILSLRDIFISCHSNDRLNYRLFLYPYREIRFLKVLSI